MEHNRSLGLLSISRKGGNIVYGEETVGAQTRAGRARLVILASDAGAHTLRRAKSFVAGTRQQLVRLAATKDEMGMAIGRTSLAIAAITDVGLALSLVKTLDEARHKDVLSVLEEMDRRARQRQKEAKAHQQNKRIGKRKK